MLRSNQGGDVPGDNWSALMLSGEHTLLGAALMTLDHMLLLGHQQDAELVLAVGVQPRPTWSWQRLWLPRLFPSTVTAVLAVTRITAAAATRIPAAATRIAAVSCRWAAGRIHSGAEGRLLCNP